MYKGYGRGKNKNNKIIRWNINVGIFNIFLTNMYFILTFSCFVSFDLEKYDYQAQESWDHYDEKWDPYSRQQGQGYHDQYYG